MNDVRNIKDQNVHIMRDYAAGQIQLALKSKGDRWSRWTTLDLENARALAMDINEACAAIERNRARLGGAS